MKQRQHVHIVQFNTVRRDRVGKSAVYGGYSSAVANQRRLGLSTLLDGEPGRDPAAARLAAGECDAQVVERQRRRVVDKLLRNVGKLKADEMIGQGFCGGCTHAVISLL